MSGWDSTFIDIYLTLSGVPLDKRSERLEASSHSQEKTDNIKKTPNNRKAKSIQNNRISIGNILGNAAKFFRCAANRVAPKNYSFR